MSREQPASILDVARAAGVSGMTVSRVLNGQPNVRAATRTRVLAAVEELHFRPSRVARALSTKRSRTIGLLVAAGEHYGPASCVSAVEDAARQRGYYTTVARLGADSPDALAAAVGDLLDQDVEGIAVVSPRAGVMSGLAPLTGGVPVVAAQSGHERGARMMMRYLIGQGHRRILHVAGPPDWDEAHARLMVYESELLLAGLPVLPPVFGDWTAESGYAAGHLLLWGRPGTQAGPGFTAAFSANDQMALGLIHALREAGLDVPGDVSVAGFDDIPEAAHFWPPLTTVRQHFGEAGRNCIALLIDAIGEIGNPDAAAPAPGAAGPQLMVRNSVAAMSPASEAGAPVHTWPQAGRRQRRTDVA
ncbi:LacI family transcriptional regulator [Trebonia kvetii]|uniref:LacI family transcriptional regulator n=1 Tax=Trebonia kvetii TaxID=2480626 RepID=A0A6P2C4I2_9ACTN|nr:LacI family DNA-binding transcriptional regulator [Trebonia kvetii]TVZ06332.1 LacI family transcriptional regulator [Trebonia kvetii]